MATNTDIKFKEDTDVLSATDEFCSLIVWNDEVNTFDWVIETLIEVCGHSQDQASSSSSFAMKAVREIILAPRLSR